MSASAVASQAAVVLAAATSVGTLYYGWRRRVADAARMPFIAGKSALADAQAALELRAGLIRELTQSEADLKARLTQAHVSEQVQQEEIGKLQTRLSVLEGENRDLLARAQAAEAAGRDARTRLSQVEEQLAGLQRKFNLGPDAGY